MPGENQGQLPLLIFPQPSPVERQGSPQKVPTVHVPGTARQVERLTPKFQSLQAAFDARRLELQATVHNNDPDLVVVFETIGAVNDFIASAERVPGLEWLAGLIETQIEPDEDFYSTKDADKPLSGKLFLMGSNRQALDEVVRLWNLYQAAPTGNLGQGLNAWKGLFKHLKEVRFWGPQDRLDEDLRQAWRFRLENGVAALRFEIEAWCFSSAAKNTASSDEVRALVGELGGRVLDEHLMLDIAYHGFLIEMPAQGIQQLLDAAPAPLLRSERVMFLRPQGQATARVGDGAARLPDVMVPQQRVSGAPIVAMLDGLPLANHARLQGRLIVDDPDQWADAYPAGERVHGTAMASLIAWGELDAAGAALAAPIYVRPILRPDPASNARAECTPDDRLLVDLVHVAVRRMFEGAGPGVPPAAPTVKVINISVGDKHRPFAGELSPWARLLDWLAYKYRVLFIVSSGNRADDLILNLARESLQGLTPEVRASVSIQALMQQDMHSRLLSPAESVNALTVGACYSDGAIFGAVPGRYTLFPERGVAPYSCIGPGFRRAIKPEVLLPGGRVLYQERPMSPANESHLRGVWHTTQAPGQRVASIPDLAGDTIYTRGTSNAAALATRWAARAFDVLEVLRAGNLGRLAHQYDAVLIKALLAHGANLGDIEGQLLSARPDVEHWHAKRRLVSRYAGYGVADVDRALTCTEQRATMLGVGELRNEKAWEFRVPIPESLNATLVTRRLTVTLAWFTPPNPRHSKYRTARLWVDLPDNLLRLKRMEGEPSQLQLGTLQHETFEGEGAVPVVPGQDLLIRVNCLADAGRLVNPVEFALCVSLEVAEGVALPIYEQVRTRIAQRIVVGTDAS